MPSEELEKQLSDLNKRRNAVKSSVISLGRRIGEMEDNPHNPDNKANASLFATKLESLSVEFKAVHYQILSFYDDERDLEGQQAVLDDLDTTVSSLILRLNRVVAKDPPLSKTPNPRTTLSLKLKRVQASLVSTEECLTKLETDGDDEHLAKQNQERLEDCKKSLDALYEQLAGLAIEEDDELLSTHTRLEGLRFDYSHRLMKCIKSPSRSSLSSTVEESSTKMPKLDVPTFDGEILNWQKFWDQFVVAVHERKNISNAERLLYLEQALKGGSAAKAIEGLSRTGTHYEEAVKHLKERYDKPRLVFRERVRNLISLHPVKDGSGKELRRFYEVAQQNLRAINSMGMEDYNSLITALLELKLDPDTMFFWQNESKKHVAKSPPFSEILSFVDGRAQAAESSSSSAKCSNTASSVQTKKSSAGNHSAKPLSSFTVNTTSTKPRNCILCPSQVHPLHSCPKFESKSVDDRNLFAKSNRLCYNCLRVEHSTAQCISSNRCCQCRGRHHTLLHWDRGSTTTDSASSASENASSQHTQTSSTDIATHAAVKLQANTLLMTSQVLVSSSDGSSVRARALLDTGSAASFLSERLATALNLPRARQKMRISGIAGSSLSPQIHSSVNFSVSSINETDRKINVTAVVLPKVTHDLPVSPVVYQDSWQHLHGIQLADPHYGQPGRVDLLLGIDVYVEIERQGRRRGPPGSPMAFETLFGWVLGGGSQTTPVDKQTNSLVTSCHSMIASTVDVLQRFWEVEETPKSLAVLTPEERAVMRHFDEHHSRTPEGRFIVPLPKKQDVHQLGESRSQAVRRFLALERSLTSKQQFQAVDSVIQEYFRLNHAEQVPSQDLNKTDSQVFYLPMHVVYKDSSSSTKIRAVFDASAKSTTGVSLNDLLMVGPTVHPPLLDVLLRFRTHAVALTADVTKMYRAVELTAEDQDLHRFVWRRRREERIQDYRMRRITFGVSASCFAANMAVKRNAEELKDKFPLAAQAVMDSFYVDDGLTGAENVQTAITLRKQLQELFMQAGFQLKKWNSSSTAVMSTIPDDLKETNTITTISGKDCQFAKTLGIKWNVTNDSFQVSASQFKRPDMLTKRVLLSNIAKVFDVLGWMSSTVITMKILLQRLWETGTGWDDPVPDDVAETWDIWQSELPQLTKREIPRRYCLSDGWPLCELHGFSDASESAYAGVVYLRSFDKTHGIHVSLVIAKTKVSPIKRLSIPRLELCGAVILARLMKHVGEVLKIPPNKMFAWTDSSIVLYWLKGNPKKYKTFVGNRIAEVTDGVPKEQWRHVSSEDNPADCASRGLSPVALLEHTLWWNGPPWLSLESSQWPKPAVLIDPPLEDTEVCLTSSIKVVEPVVHPERYSQYSRLVRITAWSLRFIRRCKKKAAVSQCLSIQELHDAEIHQIKTHQQLNFAEEVSHLKSEQRLPRRSNLRSLFPYLDKCGVLRVKGRSKHSELNYDQKHPMILSGKTHLARLIIRCEHIKLLHAGPTLVYSSISRRFHLVGGMKSVKSVLRACVVCRRHEAKPEQQQVGSLPKERVVPAPVFSKVGIDYAGPLLIKIGPTRKSVYKKAYVSVFVCMAVKAIHLELVTELTTEAFLAALRRFVSRRGLPSDIYSDHGTNFVGARRELSEIFQYLNKPEVQKTIADSCSARGIQWHFIPERAPHFGGLWEAAVKSFKRHLKKVAGDVKMCYEELSTVLTQIEACLNSRPLAPMIAINGEGVEALTPGHFLAGRPLCALPDREVNPQPSHLLRRWHLCQQITQHFWRRWSDEYLLSMRKFYKWNYPKRNLQVGDVVVLREDGMKPTHWPLGRVQDVYPGDDGQVRVARVKTTRGLFKRPIQKLTIITCAN